MSSYIKTTASAGWSLLAFLESDDFDSLNIQVDQHDLREAIGFVEAAVSLPYKAYGSAQVTFNFNGDNEHIQVLLFTVLQEMRARLSQILFEEAGLTTVDLEAYLSYIHPNPDDANSIQLTANRVNDGMTHKIITQLGSFKNYPALLSEIFPSTHPHNQSAMHDEFSATLRKIDQAWEALEFVLGKMID